MSRNSLLLALAAILALPVLAQDKAITFDNVVPAKTVRLQNGGTLSIGVDGNMTAKCLNADADAANCDDIGTSSGSAPTVSLATSGFTEPADNGGAYPAGTRFTLTPTVTNAEACMRLLEAGTPSVSNWVGNSLVIPPVAAEQIIAGTTNSNYGFLLRCFSAGGALTSAPARVATNANSVGGGEQCNAGAVVPPAFPPDNFTRNSSPTSFTQLLDFTGNTCQEFPSSGGGVCRFNSSRGRYTSLRFVVPTDPNAFLGLSKEINWNENQIDGEADSLRVYLSISQCPGDFRVPSAVAPVDPVNDPTYSIACRNFPYTTITAGSLAFRTIKYNLDGVPSNAGGEMRCGLTPGKTYYFNMVLAHPDGGITQGEHRCKNNLEFCGLQIKVE